MSDIPGLIDTHTHASQFPNAGIGMELTLLDWLKTYTFPTEAGLAKNERAAEVYSRCVRSTLDAGTTTAVYFATIHKDTSVLLADICSKMGQRAFVGKVNMDRNSPENYCEDTEDSLSETVAFVDSVARLGSELELAMARVYEEFGTVYRHGCTSCVMYRAGGTMTDWAWEELGVRRPYTLELRNLCDLPARPPARQRADPAAALPVHEVRQGECDDAQCSQSTVGNVEPIQLVEPDNL